MYKVYATHQAAHLEFGSFFFRFARAGALLATHAPTASAKRDRAARRQRAASAAWITDMERFFDLFDDRQLASDLFAHHRGHAHRHARRREYGGIRAAWMRTQENEARAPPPPSELPLRQALVENLDPRQPRRRRTR